jgi:hypothetical protein
MYHGPVAAQDCFPCGGETWWQGYVESICERPEHALEAAVNGKFSDPGKESSVIGTIATGLFDRIPESQLVSPKVFTEHRCQIPYNAALALRKAKIPVCAESVSEFIEKNRLDGELQRLLDATNTVPWRENWSGFPEASVRGWPLAPKRFPLLVRS